MDSTENPCAGKLRANFLGRLRSAHARQTLIQERDVWIVGSEKRQRLLAGRSLCAHDHVWLERNDARQSHAHEIVIVHDHDLEFVGHSSAQPARATTDTIVPAGTLTRKPCPRTGRTVDVQEPTELVHPLPDALQPEVGAAGRALAGFQPLSVICHDEIGRVSTKTQLDLDVRGPTMFQRVGQRFQTDPEQMMFLGGIQALNRAGDTHVRFGRRVERHLPGKALQRSGEIAGLERLRAQIHDGSSRLLEAVPQHLACEIQRLAGSLGCGSERPVNGFELQRETGQSLLERIVQFAGDARALVQHGLILQTFAVGHRARSPCANAGRERQDGDHHRRVAQRPPRSGRQHSHVAWRTQVQAEVRRRTALVRIGARDRQETASVAGRRLARRPEPDRVRLRKRYRRLGATSARSVGPRSTLRSCAFNRTSSAS